MPNDEQRRKKYSSKARQLSRQFSTQICQRRRARFARLLTKIVKSFVLLHFARVCDCADGDVCPSGMMALYNGATCTNDLTCQALATGFFCLRGRCCAQIIPPPGGYGTSCLNDGQCQLPNAQCKRNVCYCRPGFSYNGDNDCVPRIAYDPVNIAPNGGGGSPNCLPGQVLINANCYGYVGFGGFCDFSRQCNFADGVCRANRCGCASGQVFDGVACINDPKTATIPWQLPPLLSAFSANKPRPQGPPPPARFDEGAPGGVGGVGRGSMPTQGFRQQTRLLEQTAPFQFQPPNGFSLGRSLGPQIQRPSALECLAAEVFVNGECLQRRLSGQACVYDQQCASLDGFQRLACVEGVCSSIQFLELQPPQPLPPPQILQNLPLNEMSPQGFPIQLPQPPPPPLQQPPPFPQQQPQVPPPLLPQPLPPSLLPPQQTQFPPSNILRVGDEYIPMEAGLLSQFLQLNFHCEEPHSWRGSENCVAVAPPTTAAHEVACGAGQLRINGVCYPIVGPGESCAFDMQCRSPVLERGMFCDNFVCRFADLRQWNPYPHELEFPVCRNPSAEVELSATIPKDCIYQRCSPGFHCEYNAVYKGGQYVCCGAHVNNPIYGQIKMYPGYTNLPLQCKAINSCTFVDFPFCVFSESYRHRVCCSRPQCL